MDLKHYMEKYPPYKKLVIKSLEYENTIGTVIVIKIVLAIPIKQVVGSVYTYGNNGPLVMNNVTELYVTSDSWTRINFVTRKKQLIHAKTRLHLDVSKAIYRGDELIRLSRVWLTDTKFRYYRLK